MPEIFSNVSSLTASLEDFSISWDLGVIVFLFIAGFIYAFTVGQKKLVFLMISSYIAYLLVGMAPYLDDFIKDMPDINKFAARGGAFLILTLIIFFLSSGSIFRLSFKVRRGDGAPIWQQAVLSFSVAGFLISSCLALLPSSYYNNLSTLTQEFFLLNNTHFWWALVSVVVLILLKKKND